MTKTLLKFLLVMLLIPTQSRAFECGKALTKAEKLICKEESLVKMDKDYNSIYSNTISGLSTEPTPFFKQPIPLKSMSGIIHNF